MPSNPGAKFPRVHIYAFRMLLVTSILPLVHAVPTFSHWRSKSMHARLEAVLVFEIILHHICSLIPSATLPNMLDLILLLAELSGWLALLGKDHIQYIFDSEAPEVVTVYVISTYIQISALVILLGCRVYRLVGAGRKGLLAKFDFGPVVGQQVPIPWRSVLFGESLLKARYRNESSFTRRLRALIAYLCICGIIIYSLFVLVVGPVRETAFPPVKEFRGSGLMQHLYKKLDLSVWRIFVLVDSHTIQKSNITAVDLRNSINVTALWGVREEACEPELQAFSYPNDGTQYKTGIRTHPFNVTVFRCLTRDALAGSLADDHITSRNHDPLADLLVVVNFTAINIIPESLANSRQQAVSIVVGFTDNNAEVILNAVPTPLFPGSHLHASMLRQVRRILTPPSLSSFGIFGPSETFLTAQLASLAPDPSPLIDRRENTATLRIFIQNDPSDWTLVQDYREHYFLDGVSSIGGFWAFINGLFALFFGTTLAMIMFNKKHLSVFGVLDGVGKHKIREHFHEKYPKLLLEQVPPDQRGLLELLREYVIDLDILDQGSAGTPENTTITNPPHYPEMVQDSRPLTV